MIKKDRERIREIIRLLRAGQCEEDDALSPKQPRSASYWACETATDMLLALNAT